MSTKAFGLSIVIGGALGKSFVGSVGSARQLASRLGKEVRETNKKLGATQALVKYKNKLDQLAQKAATFKGNNTRLNNVMAELNRRYLDAEKRANKYGISVGNVVREQRRLERQLKATTRAQKTLNRKQTAGERLGSLRVGALSAVGAAYAGSRVFGSAMNLEDQGVLLRTVINAEDKDAAVARAKTHAKNFALDDKTIATEEEILNIEYSLNSAGLDEQVSRAGTELVHKLAKVTRGEAGQVGEVFGVTFNNMAANMEGSIEDKMQRIGNVLAKTQFKFQIRDFGQLGESLKMASAQAVSAKVSLEQTAVAVGALNSAGLFGGQAGTAFSAMLRNINKASNALGFDVVRDNKGQLDLLATISNLRRELDGFTTDERNTTLQKLFGDEGMRGIVPMLEGLDQIKEGYLEVEAVASSALVNEEYNRFVESSRGGWTQFTNNLAAVGHSFATVLLPALNAVVKPIGKVMAWVAHGIEKYPVIGQIVGGLAIGITAFSAGLAVVTAATWLWNAALLANPIGLIIGAVAALAVGVYALWENWDSVWTWIKDKSASAWQFVGNLLKDTPFQFITDGLAIVGSSIVTLWNNWDEIWTSIKAKAADAAEFIGKLFEYSPLGLLFKAGQHIGGAIGDLFADDTAATNNGSNDRPTRLSDIVPNQPAVRSRAGRSIQTNDDNRTYINVKVGSDADGKSVAQEINKVLDERDRARTSRQRAALFDVEPEFAQ